ncbi:MAG: hypothetical protein WDN00_16045 [Limisphaerales bacterium]
MQVVATKPIARWQIWLGKWLGIMSLNAVLLALSGGCVYGLLEWRASKLPPAVQKELREQVLVARGVAKEKDITAEIDAEAAKVLQERVKNSPVTTIDLPEVQRRSASGSRRNIRSRRPVIRTDGRLTWDSRKIISMTSRCNCG